MPQCHIVLTPDECQVLKHLREHSPKPYVRERAAAILKISEGIPASVVAQERLLQRRKPETVLRWLHRFEQEKTPALYIRPGRGRKPAFSP